MAIATLGAMMAVSCKGKEDGPAQKPVVTESMYSVTANAETGEVVFKFNEAGLSPYWTVMDPKGTKTTFTDREVVKNFEINGEYNGTIAAFGQAGESDPVSFTFTIAIPVDPTISETEVFLMSTKWRLYHFGYCADESVDWWDWEAGPVPGEVADDVLTFGKDGVFTLNQGDNTIIYNDQKGGITSVTLTGKEKWSYVTEGDAEFVQFLDGGFPGMVADDKGFNGRYAIREITENSFRLYYHQPEVAQYFYLTLVPEDYVEPAVSIEDATAAISGKSFSIAAYGWWGEGWEWFEEPVPANCVDDVITFKTDGSLVLNLGETPAIYNDGWTGPEMPWTVTGKETWALGTDESGVVVEFANGGFPLMLAGNHVEEGNPELTFGLDAHWTVAGIDDEGAVRLEIYQPFNGQWLTVFLAPAD